MTKSNNSSNSNLNSKIFSHTSKDSKAAAETRDAMRYVPLPTDEDGRGVNFHVVSLVSVRWNEPKDDSGSDPSMDFLVKVFAKDTIWDGKVYQVRQWVKQDLLKDENDQVIWNGDRPATIPGSYKSFQSKMDHLLAALGVEKRAFSSPAQLINMINEQRGRRFKLEIKTYTVRDYNNDGKDRQQHSFGNVYEADAQRS